jgi:hypothetical protein
MVRLVAYEANFFLLKRKIMGEKKRQIYIYIYIERERERESAMSQVFSNKDSFAETITSFRFRWQ